MSKANAVNTVLELDLKGITVSKLNPRKHFDEAKMKELTASVKEKGVIQPIIVRPVKSGYEIICGERRYRASIAAGKKTIPAVVKDLTDVQVLEFQCIENLQREDVHPLEEAEGYEALMKKHGCKDVKDIAAKVGKSPTYIYGRLKLLELIPDNRKLFYDGKLSASVALLVSRIPKDLQKEAGRYCAGIGNGEPLSYNRAHEHIQDEYMLLLKEAPFDTKDKTLGINVSSSLISCFACPKRTGNQKELFADIKSADVCTDLACFNEKKNAFMQRTLAKLKQQGKKILSVEESKKLFTYQHSTTPERTYKNLDEKNYNLPKCPTYRDLVKRVKGIEIIYAIQPYTGRLIEMILQTDIPKILSQLGIKINSGNASVGSIVDLEKSKARNRINEAERGFWINKLQAKNDPRCMKILLLNEILDSLGCQEANKLVPFKTKQNYCSSWDIPKLYELGDTKIQEITIKAVSKKYEYLSEDDLKFLSEKLGYNVAKDYVITEAYLQAMTKEQLINLAEEIGLMEYMLQKQIKPSSWPDVKKPVLIDLFLKKDFPLASKVPKELKK